MFRKKIPYTISMADVVTDLLLHLICSLFAGYIAWKKFKGKQRTLLLCIAVALLSGLFIDLDHLFDYFMAFGLNFSLFKFFNGDMFVESGKAYVVFHAWEFLLVACVFFFRAKKKQTKMFLLAFILSMFLHLAVDITLFQVPFQEYSIIYRASKDFVINP